MIDQIRDMVIFAKVAEAGSFRGAARTLGISPSVVSQHIANLELRLGAALIYRSTRSFSLTPDGEKLLPSAQAMLVSAEEGLSHFSDQSIEPVGVLRLSVPAVLQTGPFIENLAKFAELNPGIALRVNFSDARRDLIREGFDLAISMGWLADSSLKAKKLGKISRRLVASPDYVKRHKKPRSPSDLETWRIIRFEPTPDGIELEHPKKGKMIVQGEVQVSVDSAVAMHHLALTGGGLAMMLSFMADDDLKDGRLIEVLPAWRLSSPGAYAVWPPNAPRLGLSRKLVSFLEANMKFQPTAKR